MERSLQRAFENESIVSRVMAEQSSNGVVFNLRRANRYLLWITAKKEQLYKRIRPLLSLEVRSPYNVPINKPFNKDGTPSSSVKAWYGDETSKYPDIGGRFTRVSFEEPDLGSRQKLQRQLLKLGWIPRSFTEKGNPRLTVEGEPCESLIEIDSQVGKDIAQWYILSHRESQIKGWINRLRDDQRLSAEAFPIGTPTFRMRHKTVVNVPKAKRHVVFGKQMRSLFTVPLNKVMVGHDASGLELRMLAHFINDPDFIRAVTEGKEEDGTDIHTLNQKMAGLPTRDAGKTFIYAFNYGAGDEKIGSIIGGTATDGRKIKQQFLEANPKLADLINRVQEAAKRGYLMGLDGRRIYMRRDSNKVIQVHKALNTLLQASGAIVMKHSMVILDRLIKQHGLRSKKVIDMHDEAQFECYPEEAELHGQLARQSIIQAGEELNLNCPLDAEYKIGKNWAQTH